MQSIIKHVLRNARFCQTKHIATYLFVFAIPQQTWHFYFVFLHVLFVEHLL